MLDKGIDLLLNLEKWPKMITHALEYGVHWALFCTALFYYSWGLWPIGSDKKTIFFILFIACGVVSAICPFALSAVLKDTEKKAEERVRQIRNDDKQVKESIVETVIALNDSYYDFLDFVQSHDFWLKSREQGLEKEALSKGAKVEEYLKRLRGIGHEVNDDLTD